jgi:hypothetical protein
VLGPAALPPSALRRRRRRRARAGRTPDALRFSPEGEPVVAVASKGARGRRRPERTNTWLDPRDASVIDQASANAGRCA